MKSIEKVDSGAISSTLSSVCSSIIRIMARGLLILMPLVIVMMI